MKTTLEYFYSIKGVPVPHRLTNFKTILFGYGTTPAIDMNKAVTTGITVSGATTTGILVSGVATRGILVSGAATTGISVTGATGVGLNIEGTPTSYGIQITATTGSAIGIFCGTIDYGVNIAGSGTTGVGVIINTCTTAGIVLYGTTTTGIDIAGTIGQGIKLGNSGGATSASGLLMGIGTSANPTTTSVAAANFVEIRCQTTAATGGGRGVYVRYDIAADGTSTGEAVRGLVMITKAVGSFTGVSGGVEFHNTTGAISGSATGGSFTMLINAAGQTTGGLYGASVIMHMGGTGGPPTMHAPLEIRVAGNATGAAKVLNAISFAAPDCADAAGGEMISPGSSMGAVTGTIRVLINGAARFMPYYSHEGYA